MGLHTGEANVGSDGYVGYAVHQAARIGDAGHGGQVLLSNTTAGLVRHDLPRELEPGRSRGRSRCPTSTVPSASSNSAGPGLEDEFPPLSVRELTKARPRAPRRRTEVQVSRVPLLEREAELAAHATPWWTRRTREPGG